jgi:hypothetical protein
MGIGDWGLGIGDWGLGIGDWAQSPFHLFIINEVYIIYNKVFIFKILFKINNI